MSIRSRRSCFVVVTRVQLRSERKCTRLGRTSLECSPRERRPHKRHERRRLSTSYLSYNRSSTSSVLLESHQSTETIWPYHRHPSRPSAEPRPSRPIHNHVRPEVRVDATSAPTSRSPKCSAIGRQSQRTLLRALRAETGDIIELGRDDMLHGLHG